jgi:hypothetical protein
VWEVVCIAAIDTIAFAWRMLTGMHLASEGRPGPSGGRRRGATATQQQLQRVGQHHTAQTAAAATQQRPTQQQQQQQQRQTQAHTQDQAFTPRARAAPPVVLALAEIAARQRFSSQLSNFAELHAHKVPKTFCKALAADGGGALRSPGAPFFTIIQDSGGHDSGLAAISPPPPTLHATTQQRQAAGGA